MRTIRFVSVDDEGADRESRAFAPDGESFGEPTSVWTSWLQSQEHASFPREVTVIDPEAVSTPLGRQECRVYTVADGESVSRYWLAVARPGMPAKVETRVQGELTYTMTMIEDTIS